MTLTAAHQRRYKRALAHAMLALLFGLGSGQVMAADLNISDKPLDTLEGVPANIILTMDDSGSMAWGFLPDIIGGYCPGSSCTDLADSGNSDDLKRATSASFNKIYYDPNATYLPALDENGASLGDADFDAAWDNGLDQDNGVTVNLGTDFEPPWYRGVFSTPATLTHTDYSGAAFYHVFDSTNLNCDGTVDDNDCYDKVVVSSTSGPGGTDERQNFANWYSYYRYRSILAKTAASHAFSQLSGSIRIAYQDLNHTAVTTLQPFAGTARTNFFNWLYDVPTDGSTILRRAFKRAGEKFSTAEAYEKEPGVSGTPEYSCRQNFHFAFTDGAWNGSDSYVDTLNGVNYTDNYDGGNSINITLPETVNGVSNYTPRPPYEDDNSQYLGDISMFFWANDLRPGLSNDVPQYIVDRTDYDGDGDEDDADIFWNPKNDPATWQHMVSFTIGFGVAGNLNFPGDYTNLVAGTQAWGDHEVDDLWHAAINSRGNYFSASNPQQLLASFSAVLGNIDSRIGSSSAVATTSSQYQTGTNLFQAIYNPSSWSGDLLAKDVFTLNQQWSAAGVLAQQIDGSINSPRQIVTFDPSNNGGGIPFLWSDLTPTQQSALRDGGTVAEGQARLAYLRGDTSNEIQNTGTYSFRNREKALGDIVHSDPFFLPPPGAPLFFWPDDLETAAYSTFVAGRSGRQDMVLFGANDGMLHIVNANTGREILAYVPNAVFDNLSDLTDPAYTHKFFVDAPVQVSDVFFGGSWHTVAVGGLGKGGKGIYALDITDPAAFLESNADNLVLWEFTDADLGYTYTKPQIFKMNNGKWVVAVGNGYNSGRDIDNDGDLDRGYATLYLLDIETGSVIKTLETPWGIDEDPSGLGRSNRLTDVVALDQNQDFQVDILYAGDLFGNLWKFDVSDSVPTKWEIAKSGSTPTPLFQARDDSGNPQPITVAPAIQYHDTKHGYLIYVGTGKYLEVGDLADASLQTIYGVWDREETSGITTITRAALREQEILGANRSQFTLTNARITTDNKFTWYDGSGLPKGNPPKAYLGWYMDLIDSGQAAQGERILDDLFVSGDRLEFITLIPSTDPCQGGGESWLFAVNAITGSRFTTNTPWDYNQDGRYDTDDKVDWSGSKVWGSGINLKTPQRFRRTKLLEPGSDCQEINLLNNSDGSITTVSGSCQGFNYGRRSWRQLHIQ